MKNFLKSIRLSVLFIMIISSETSIKSQTLINENFSYPAGTALTSNGWSAHSSAGTNPPVIHSQGLAFPSYPSSNIGLSALLGNNGEDVNRSFTSVTSGSVYCAFLVKVNSIANDYFIHFSNASLSTNRGRVFINGSGSAFNFGISKGAATGVLTTGSPYTTGSTYLLVIKYKIVEGINNDEASLYVITGSIPLSEPALPTIGPVKDTLSDLSSVSSIALRQYSALENILIDGIRVTSTWSDAISTATLSERLNSENNIQIYPVPVSDELTIRNLIHKTEIEIIDVSGKRVYINTSGPADALKINLRKLNKGLYFISFRSEKLKQTFRIIKN